MEKRRRKWGSVFLPGLFAVLIAGWFMRSQADHPVKEFLTQETAQLGQAWGELIGKGGSSPNGATPLKGSESSAPEQLTKASGPTIFSISPHVRRYRIIAKKALRTEAENQEMEALLSNHEALAEAKNALLQEDNAYFTEGNLISRIRVIDYLNKAASWADNPSQQQVRQTLVEFLKTPVTNPSISTEGRQARATDRIEVYYILKKHHPDLAQELQQNAEAYGLQKIIAYAEENEKKMNFAAVQP